MAEILQNTAYARSFLMVLSSDSKTGATGKTVTVTLAKAGGAFAAAAGTVTEQANGWYVINLTSVDTNTAGDLAYHCTAASCDPTDFADTILTQAQASAPVTSTQWSSSLTRDQLIQQAYKMLGVLEEGETLSSALQADAILSLNMIMRQLSDQDIFLHAQATAVLTLSALTWVYTTSTGLPSNCQRLTSCVYRDPWAVDWPMVVQTRVQYEALHNKVESGDPASVFLTDDTTLASRTLYVYPALSTVNAVSVVTGTDANPYQCIRGHVADSTTQPITGANYLLYWASGGSSPTTWTSGTTYSAAAQLRLTYERPLYDFGSASDNPDLPGSQTLYLKYRLATDLAPNFNLAIDRIGMLSAMADKLFYSTFKKSMQKSRTQRPVGVYF